MPTALSKACILIFCLLLGLINSGWAQSGGPASNVDFYVVAHQDDWQLFMGSQAYDDVQRRRTKVVFICVTAGQGYVAGDEYWKARELGCQTAVQTAADQNSPPLMPHAGTRTLLNGHRVESFRYKNTVTYFLRTPDGGTDGKGFAHTNYESLRRLRARQCTLTCLDQSTTYNSWTDLRETVRQIISQEAGRGDKITVNCAEYNSRRNPDDHSDHLMASSLAREATKALDCQQLLYIDYATAKKPVNLSAAQTGHQTTVFGAYCKGLTSAGQPTEWDAKHLVWIGKQYSRIRHNNVQALPTPQPAAPATIPDTAALAQHALVLEPNFPNPFSLSSQLVYHLPKAGFVTLRIHDLHGRVVQTLVEASQPPGRYEVWLDINEFPAEGIYLCRLQVGDEHREIRVQISR